MTNNIDITKLTTEQLAALRKQMKAIAKEKTGDVTKRNGVIDKMLQTKDGEGYAFTTADILAELQNKGIVAKELSNDDRAAQLKMIQTRKQKLDKKPEFKGKVGYKPSATGIGAMDVHRVIAWLNNASKADRDMVSEAIDDLT